MENPLKNLKTILIHSRSRLVFLVGLVIAAVVFLFVVLSFLQSDGLEDTESSSLSQVPYIQSLPGSINPTEEYAKLQESENRTKAKKARQTGGSAIPTIVRTEKFGEGQNIPNLKEGTGGLGFSTLSRAKEGGQQKAWLQNLLNSNCSDRDIQFAQQQGATVKDLLQACSCLQLKVFGMKLSDLKQGCSCQKLKQAGVTAKELKAEGWNAQQLKLCGFSACELKAAGFTAKQMRAAGFTAGELRGAGFTDDAIRLADGLSTEVSEQAIRDAKCDVTQLKKLKAQGVGAAAIRRLSGCDAQALKAAGFTAKELKEAGFSAAQLRDAGFTVTDLKDAGFSARDLKQAGYSAQELKAGGFALEALKAAGYSAQALKAAGFTEKELLQAGFTPAQLADLQSVDVPKDCTVEQLKLAKDAGVDVAEIKRRLGCSAAALRAAGFSAKALRDAGFSARALKNAGFNAQALKDAGFTAAELKQAGFTARALRQAGFDADDLREAGFTAAELKQAGFTARALRDAGFTVADLKEAGFSPSSLKAAGFTASELKEAGFSAEDLLKAGFSAQSLKEAGFSKDELKAAGVDAATLSHLGFSSEDAEPPKRLPQPSNTQLARRHRKEIQSIRLSMQSHAQRIFNEWQVSDSNLVESQNKDQATDPTTPGPIGGGDADLPGTHAFIKAGDIHFAVLDTEINSDEKGPVLAHIVHGTLKGTKLIGSITQPDQGQRVILRFDLMSIPGAKQTISINAVAIDMETARTALSSDTDNHYFSRYGSLLASAFLEGFGNSFAAQGTQIDINGTTITSQQFKKSLGENAITALSKVGQKWGDAIATNINRPPTVKVYSGVGLGLLFMQDVTQEALLRQGLTTEAVNNG